MANLARPSGEPVARRPLHWMVSGRCVASDAQRQPVCARHAAETCSSFRAASGFAAKLATQMVNGRYANSIACPLMRDASTTAHRVEPIAWFNVTGENWCPCSTSRAHIGRQSIPQIPCSCYLPTVGMGTPLRHWLSACTIALARDFSAHQGSTRQTFVRRNGQDWPASTAAPY